MCAIHFLHLCIAVSYGVICFNCHLASVYRQEIGLYLPLMALKGIFLFIRVWVSTYQEEEKYGRALKRWEM